MILPSVGNLAPLLFYLDFPSLAEVALAERDFLPESVVDFDTICRLTVFSYCLLIRVFELVYLIFQAVVKNFKGFVAIACVTLLFWAAASVVQVYNSRRPR